VYAVHLSSGSGKGKPVTEQSEAGRRPLNTERVLRAAVAFADATGIDSLSMRRLAQELGGVPMTLYKHVANKEERAVRRRSRL
jgi:AcrR family transcriptional regulator